MFSWVTRNRLGFIAITAVGLGAVGLTLLRHWEGGHETWTYWFFARVFAETGEFIVPDRSPLYILYLNAFWWLGFPANVAVEFVVTSSAVVAAMATLFRRYISLPLAVFAALLWLPFLQTAEPSLQMLALAFTLWSVVVRLGEPGRMRMPGSYALMGVAYLLRPTFAIFILLFVMWDLYGMMKQRGTWNLLKGLRPNPGSFSLVSRTGLRSVASRGWPFLLLAALLIWFNVMQSDHRWNNVWVSSTEWYPYSDGGKSVTDSHIIAAFNSHYVLREYGLNSGQDIYFTNEEVFDGAGTALGAIRANPRFILEQSARNIKDAPPYMIGLSGAPAIYAKLRLPQWYYFSLIIVAIILFGAVRAATEPTLRLFLIGSVIIVISHALVFPYVTEHFIPLIPVLTFGAIWYGLALRRLLMASSPTSRMLLIMGGLAVAGLVFVYVLGVYVVWRSAFLPPLKPIATVAVVMGSGLSFVFILLGICDRSDRARNFTLPLRRLFAWSAVPVALILFSTALTTWPDLLVDVGRDVRDGELKPLERRDERSLKVSRLPLQTLAKDCKGVLASDHVFIGTFSDVPVYDITELPPFGSLGDSVYDGLRPDRIDCVLVTDYVRNSRTNRYERYIEPYVRQLTSLGAVTYDVPRLGQIVILNGSD